MITEEVMIIMASENTQLEEHKSILDSIKKWWLPGVIIYILLTLTILFVTNIIVKENTSLEQVNGWVSLILGIVATLLSVTSMWISFYSLERTNEINLENTKAMADLKAETLKQIKELNTEYMNKIGSVHNSINQTLREIENIKKGMDEFTGKTGTSSIDDDKFDDFE